MTPFDVNQVQLAGVNLVEASAGTGKTYALATLYVRLVLQAQLDVGQILVVTFTELATAELRQRIRQRLRQALEASRRPLHENPTVDESLRVLLEAERHPGRARERLERALLDFDRAEISTIHGFCQRVLQDTSADTNVPFKTELVTDTSAMVGDLVLDFWATSLQDASPWLVRQLEREQFDIAAAVALVSLVCRHGQVTLIPEEDGPLEALDTHPVHAAFQAAKASYDRTAIVHELSHCTLDRRRYRSDWLRSWSHQLETWFASGFTLDAPDKLDRFASDQLAGAARAAPPVHPFFERVTTLVQRLTEFSTDLQRYSLAFKRALVTQVMTGLEKQKLASGQLSFDDLLTFLHRALQGPRGPSLIGQIRQRYRAALIDEFQDTDPVQCSIFSQVFGHGQTSLFMIGDPKQAIYSFRGADLFAYVSAAAGIARSKQFTMTKNYRTDGALVHAVNYLFQQAHRPFLLEQIRFSAVEAEHASRSLESGPSGDAALQFLYLAGGEQLQEDADGFIARWTALHVQRLLSSPEVQSATDPSSSSTQGKALQPQDIAVLTRTNNQAFLVQKALRSLGIASVVLGDKSIYETAEALDLQRILTAMLDPTDTHLRAALITDVLGASARQVDTLDTDPSLYHRWLDRFRRYHDSWVQHGFIRAFHSFLTECEVQARLLVLNDGERRLTNILQLGELLHQAAKQSHWGPAGLLHHLSRERAETRYRGDAEQIRLESDDAAVKLTTIHKSKGLEYGVVFCPYLWGDLLGHPADAFFVYHQPSPPHAAILDLRARFPEARARAEYERSAENLRLLYVALTRAKHRCYVVWGKLGKGHKKSAQSALGYLLHAAQVAGLDANPQVVSAYLTHQDDSSFSERLHALTRDCRAQYRPAVPTARAPMGVSPLNAPYVLPSTHATVNAPFQLRARHAERPLLRSTRITSFTALAHHEQVHATVLVTETEPEYEAAPSVPQQQAPEDGATPVILADFPRGPTAGNFFHRVLEICDFQHGSEHWEATVRSELARWGFDVERWTSTVLDSLQQVVRTPLAEGLRLNELRPQDRLDEMGFMLPVAPHAPRGPSLTASALGEALRAHPSAQLPASYAQAVAQLEFPALQGHLKGFIDLVFVHNRRWYLVDYKTNHLGPSPDDYSRAKLQQAMAVHHYYLQYHLYVVALHRFLGARLPDYEYERDFAGVLYLFLRGLHPEQPERGVFFERPPRSRVNAIDRALRGTS